VLLLGLDWIAVQKTSTGATSNSLPAQS
jgi:hypothetical protein